MSKSRKVYIAVIGVGGVGATFLSQLHALLPKHGSLVPILITRSRKVLYSKSYDALDISPDSWPKALDASTQDPLSPSETLSFLSSAPGPVILADNTSSQTIAESYPSYLKAGIHIITPNKKAFSGSWDLWEDIFSSSANPPPTLKFAGNPKGGLIYHESSVGAGMPTLSTLEMLLATGDHVQKIQGVISGTLSFLFNTFAPVPSKDGPKLPSWSESVLLAKDLGYTEPDPREDLSGLDVARKLVIMARLGGLEISGTDAFPVQSLVPPALQEVSSVDEFLQRLPEFDGEMEKMREEAAEKGEVLRYVGSVDFEKGGVEGVEVGVKGFGYGEVVAGLKGADNMFGYWTPRFGERALSIQGPGAGGEITAMGVTADLLKVLGRIGVAIPRKDS